MEKYKHDISENKKKLDRFREYYPRFQTQEHQSLLTEHKNKYQQEYIFEVLKFEIEQNLHLYRIRFDDYFHIYQFEKIIEEYQSTPCSYFSLFQKLVQEIFKIQLIIKIKKIAKTTSTFNIDHISADIRFDAEKIAKLEMKAREKECILNFIAKVFFFYNFPFFFDLLILTEIQPKIKKDSPKIDIIEEIIEIEIDKLCQKVSIENNQNNTIENIMTVKKASKNIDDIEIQQIGLSEKSTSEKITLENDIQKKIQIDEIEIVNHTFEEKNNNKNTDFANNKNQKNNQQQVKSKFDKTYTKNEQKNKQIYEYKRVVSPQSSQIKPKTNELTKNDQVVSKNVQIISQKPIDNQSSKFNRNESTSKTHISTEIQDKNTNNSIYQKKNDSISQKNTLFVDNKTDLIDFHLYLKYKHEIILNKHWKAKNKVKLDSNLLSDIYSEIQDLRQTMNEYFKIQKLILKTQIFDNKKKKKVLITFKGQLLCKYVLHVPSTYPFNKNDTSLKFGLIHFLETQFNEFFTNFVMEAKNFRTNNPDAFHFSDVLISRHVSSINTFPIKSFEANDQKSPHFQNSIIDQTTNQQKINLNPNFVENLQKTDNLLFAVNFIESKNNQGQIFEQNKNDKIISNVRSILEQNTKPVLEQNTKLVLEKNPKPVLEDLNKNNIVLNLTNLKNQNLKESFNQKSSEINNSFSNPNLGLSDSNKINENSNSIQFNAQNNQQNSIKIPDKNLFSKSFANSSSNFDNFTFRDQLQSQDSVFHNVHDTISFKNSFFNEQNFLKKKEITEKSKLNDSSKNNCFHKVSQNLNEKIQNFIDFYPNINFSKVNFDIKYSKEEKNENLRKRTPIEFEEISCQNNFKEISFSENSYKKRKIWTEIEKKTDTLITFSQINTCIKETIQSEIFQLPPQSILNQKSKNLCEDIRNFCLQKLERVCVVDFKIGEEIFEINFSVPKIGSFKHNSSDFLLRLMGKTNSVNGPILLAFFKFFEEIDEKSFVDWAFGFFFDRCE